MPCRRRDLQPGGGNAALVGPDGAKSAPPGSAPAPPAAQRPAPDQPADARRSTRSRAVPAASARTSVASAGLPSDAPFGPGSVRARSDGSSPEPAYVVKGKIATKVFYTPGGAYYTRTRADVWFRTADDARAAGFTERAPAATADRRRAFRCGHRRADRSGCTAAGSGVPVTTGCVSPPRLSRRGGRYAAARAKGPAAPAVLRSSRPAPSAAGSTTERMTRAPLVWS